MDATLATLVREGLVEAALRCGAHPPAADARAAIKYSPRMERREFVWNVAGARYVLSYPGVTLLEAWYLGRIPILFAVDSPVHHELALYLERTAGLSYLQSPAD